ncbi:uncharacterized protein VTP21DRAFT_1821 [Calcarisporiella thermophila]|uniref:uncharacterized protein n=1 Tax=Calcarisporiella thermophila TaxID=911321 RepID=UPI003742BC59
MDNESDSIAEWHKEWNKLRTFLISTCSSLGGMERRFNQATQRYEEVYVMGDECLECLKDLKRMIRQDDDNPDKFVLQTLFEMSLVDLDLIPILLLNAKGDSPHQERIALACVELMVPMTWPVTTSDLLNVQKAGTALTIASRILPDLKWHLMQKEVIEAIMDVLLKPLTTPYRERSARQTEIIRLVLALFRNILAIRDPIVHSTATYSQIQRSLMQEELIIQLKEANVLELLLTFASSADEKEFSEWTTLVQEILHGLLLRIEPDSLVDIKEEVTNASSQLREKFLAEERERRRRNRGSDGRHSRFGGTIALKFFDGQRVLTHKQKQWFDEMPKNWDEGKAKQARRSRPQLDAYDRRAWIKNGKCLLCIKEFCESFLESAFNTFFPLIKRDIEQEKDSLRNEDYAHFFYLVRFFLRFQRLALPDSFDLVASMLDVRSLFLVVRRMRTSFEERRWNELHMTVDCFGQMLLTLQSMQKSSHEEYRAVSLHIQHNLFYDAYVFDLAAEIVKSCKESQSREYLRAVVAMNHHLMRVLEGFVKERGKLFVRRRQKKRKRKMPKSKGEGEKRALEQRDEENDADHVGANGTEAGVDEEDEGDEGEGGSREERLEFVEKSFEFEKFQEKLATESVVTTYMVLLEEYADLSEETLYHIVAAFHRIMVKCRRKEAIFFKLSVLEIFNAILNDHPPPFKSQAHAELHKFMLYCLRRFFKAWAANPLMCVEILFPKSSADIRRITGPDPSEATSQENSGSRGKRMWSDGEEEDGEWVPEERIKPGMPWSQKLGMAVAALVKDGQAEWVRWVEKGIRLVLEERGILEGDREEGDAELIEYRDVRLEMEEDKASAIQASTAQKMEHLMALLQFEKIAEATGRWTVPATVSTADLELDARLLDEYVAKPPKAGQSKKKPRAKRKKRDPEEEEGDEKREPRKRKMEEPVSYKSAQFVIDSSDDENDEAFFQRERALREKMKELFAREGFEPDTGKSAHMQVVVDDDPKASELDSLLMGNSASGSQSSATSIGEEDKGEENKGEEDEEDNDDDDDDDENPYDEDEELWPEYYSGYDYSSGEDAYDYEDEFGHMIDDGAISPWSRDRSVSEDSRFDIFSRQEEGYSEEEEEKEEAEAEALKRKRLRPFLRGQPRLG